MTPTITIPKSVEELLAAQQAELEELRTKVATHEEREVALSAQVTDQGALLHVDAVNKRVARLQGKVAPSVLLAGTGAWVPEHFAAVGSFSLPVTIEYRLSDKLNSKGNPYKDILAIRPVAA